MSNFTYSELGFTVLSEIQDFTAGLAPTEFTCSSAYLQMDTSTQASHNTESEKPPRNSQVTWVPLAETPQLSTQSTQVMKHHWTVLATKTFFYFPKSLLSSLHIFQLP